MTTDWYMTLPGLHSRAWESLTRGVADRDSPARHIAIATTAPDGTPEVRTVVLRAADRTEGTLDIHTDIRSAKIVALRHTPTAQTLAWDFRAHLQIRATGTATILTGPEAAALWARVPEASRPAYGATPAPGTPIPHAADYGHTDGEAAFAVIRLNLTALDLLHLGERHRRAKFTRDDDWRGQWLSP
jgi:pyridoxamine 5'-phosphate oxidase